LVIEHSKCYNAHHDEVELKQHFRATGGNPVANTMLENPELIAARGSSEIIAAIFWQRRQ